jgi:WD40 repeat protein
LRIIQAHIAPTTQISFSYDGRFIASSGDDGTISIWGICGTVHEYPAENVGWQDHHYPCIEF